MSRLIAYTGLGPSDAVVLARAQLAVTVLGFEAAEEPDAALKYTPRAALVAETHTGEGRVRSALEELVGDFARRSFGPTAVERKEVDGVSFVNWSSRDEARQKIVTAVSGSVVVVGNDEAVVRACLEVRRGARGSLAGNEQLKGMRVRLGADNALAFGFAPSGSAARMVEIFAPAFVGGVSSKPEVQSLLATLLPQLVNQLVGSVGWSARAGGGSVEDTYFLTLPGDMAERLRVPLEPAPRQESAAGGLLPKETYQLSSYSLRSPEIAWRGLNAAMSSRVDAYRASIITLALDSLLKPYGIENPRDFLRASGTEIITAKLDGAGENRLLAVEVRDREALHEQVLQHLGRGARTVRAAGEQILVSRDPELGAASLVAGYLLMGEEQDVRRCLNARERGQTFEPADAHKVAQGLFPGPTFVRTLTNDREGARAMILYLARNGGSRAIADQNALGAALDRHSYSVSETGLTAEGFEKRTRSAFGLFGEIITRFAPGR